MSERLFDIEPPDERVRFLALLEPFAALAPADLERIVAAVEERLVPAGRSGTRRRSSAASPCARTK